MLILLGKTIMHLTVPIICVLFFSGCSSLLIEIDDMSIVKLAPGFGKPVMGLEINLINSLRVNFKSNIDLNKYSKDHHLNLWANIYVCNDIQLAADGPYLIYQNVDKENIHKDNYHFSLFHGFFRESPFDKVDHYKYRTFFAINPRPELCLVVGMGTVFWSPYNLISSPTVINRTLSNKTLDRLFQWRKLPGLGSN